jgi:hypothetical protein
MTALLPMDLPDAFDWLAPIPTLEDAYRQAEIEAERAAEAVRAACEAYKAHRSAELADAYAAADRRYDAARHAFQAASFHLMQARREAARATQEAANRAAQLTL